MKILVVEDNKDAATTMAALLRRLGNDVQIAYDGLAGLSLFRDARPDVVLLDIGLPGMDGYQVARTMRSVEPLGWPFIIAITGYGTPEDRNRSAQAGIDVHLLKPVDFRKLKKLLEIVGNAMRPLDEEASKSD